MCSVHKIRTRTKKPNVGPLIQMLILVARVHKNGQFSYALLSIGMYGTYQTFLAGRYGTYHTSLAGRYVIPNISSW